MPLVQVRYKDDRVSPEHLSTICKDVLPFEVARTLTIEGDPEAELTPGDIVVWTSPAQCFDVQRTDIEIIVDAHDFPPRREKLGNTAYVIKRAVEFVIPRNTVAVWVRVFPTGFSES